MVNIKNFNKACLAKEQVSLLLDPWKARRIIAWPGSLHHSASHALQTFRVVFLRRHWHSLLQDESAETADANSCK